MSEGGVIYVAVETLANKTLSSFKINKETTVTWRYATKAALLVSKLHLAKKALETCEECDFGLMRFLREKS